MNIQDYWLIIRKRWGLLVSIIALSLAIAGGYTAISTPMYQSIAKVFVSTDSSSSISDLVSGSSFAQQRVKSYADLVTSPAVLDPVVKQLGLPGDRQKLVDRISASVPLDEVVIQIAVLDPNPQNAANIANAVAQSLSKTVNNLETPLNGNPSPIKVSLVQEGTINTKPETPKPLLNIALGLLIGLVVGIGLAVLRESLDIKVRSPRDLEELGQSSILGGVVLDPTFAKAPLIVHDHPKSRKAEAFRQLRTNIEFVEAAQARKSIVVTSAIPGDGKSTIVTNLAIALAQGGKKVLLVDCDLRKPKVAKFMGLEGSVGLTTGLVGKADYADLIQKWGKDQLYVLPAGKIPPNPSELLGSEAMRKFLVQAETEYDVVLLDSAPLLPVTDAAVLSHMTGGVALVVSVGKTTKPQVKGAISHLDAVGSQVLGIIMNKIPVKGAEAYQYRYAYRDGYAKYGYGAYGAYGVYGEKYSDEAYGESEDAKA